MLNYLSKVIHNCHFLFFFEKIITTIYEKAAELDIYNRFIIGTLITLNGDKNQRRFEHRIDGIQLLCDWIAENNCPVVICESTNFFWYPIYDSLSSIRKVIVGNAHDMKVLTHNKTDKIDFEVIARGIITLIGQHHNT